MEQLNNEYRNCIETFEKALKIEFDNEGKAAKVLEEFIPLFINKERQLSKVINCKRNSIYPKDEIVKLIKTHSVIVDLLEDVLVTPPSICNYNLIRVLFKKSNVNSKLILKYKYYV